MTWGAPFKEEVWVKPAPAAVWVKLVLKVTQDPNSQPNQCFHEKRLQLTFNTVQAGRRHFYSWEGHSHNCKHRWDTCPGTWTLASKAHYRLYSARVTDWSLQCNHLKVFKCHHLVTLNLCSTKCAKEPYIILRIKMKEGESPSQYSFQDQASNLGLKRTAQPSPIQPRILLNWWFLYGLPPENATDRGGWWATVHGGPKELDMTSIVARPLLSDGSSVQGSRAHTPNPAT